MELVKRCPFCGKEAKYSHRTLPEGHRYDCADFHCCGKCAGKWFATKEEALEAWNRRA